MSQHKENDFIVPFLMVLADKGECDTTTIKNEVGKYITLTPEDLEPYRSRNTSEARYKPLISNLIGHKNKELFKYINSKKINGTNIWFLNDNGIQYVSTIRRDTTKETKHESIIENRENEPISQVETTITHIDEPTVIGDKQIGIPTEKISDSTQSSISPQDQKVIDHVEQGKSNRRFPTTPGLIKSICAIYNYKCAYAILKGEEHHTFLGEAGNPYVEGHHLIPMQASGDFFPRSLDIAENIYPLCPTCHKMIHNGSADEKKEILKTLYDKYIDRLNDKEIYISFENLYEKYYK